MKYIVRNKFSPRYLFVGVLVSNSSYGVMELRFPDGGTSGYLPDDLLKYSDGKE